MCGLQNALLALPICLMALLQAPASSAQSADLKLFASCAGRLSALMEHQWLLSDSGSDRTALQRDAMLSLVTAMTAPETGMTAMTWRIDAKVAQAGLLAQASFAPNKKTAALAARRSEEMIGLCRSLLLG